MAIDVYNPRGGGIAIPPALANVGVTVVEENGIRAIVIPDELRRRANVLVPTSEASQLNPNWSPSPRWLVLDIEAHTYHDSNSRQDERSLNKQGLGALAEVAGIGEIESGPIPYSVTGPNARGWKVVLGVPRSDGRLRRVNGSKVIDLDDLDLEIRASVAASALKYNWPPEKVEVEILKRTAYERKHSRAKAETMAWERAVRAALQLPAAYKAADLQKPFVVIGWTFTPDTTDPEIRRLVIERGLDASSRLYGDPAGDERLALPPAPSAPEPPQAQEAAGDAGPGAPAASPPSNVDPSTGEVYPQDAGPAPDEPIATEPPAAAAPSTAPPIAAMERMAAALGVIKAAGATRLSTPKGGGKSISEVYAADPSYITWLAGSKNSPQGDEQKQQKQHASDFLAAMAIVLSGGAS